MAAASEAYMTHISYNSGEQMREQNTMDLAGKGTEAAYAACTDLVVTGMESKESGAGPRFHILRLARPDWQTWRPGQFVMVRPKKEWGDLVWGRPFSICRVTDKELVIFFQEAGRGTERMGMLCPGDMVTVWGPLGRGFAVERDTPTLMLAGGIGIAPFSGYIEQHPAPHNLTLEFGHRMPLECYPFKDMAAKITANAHCETCRADLTAFIERIGQCIHDTRDGLVLACGPMPFLRTVQKFSLECGVRAQLSLESRMACGVGACLGCVVKSAERMKNVPVPGWPVQVCQCGPVFWADEIDLNE